MPLDLAKQSFLKMDDGPFTDDMIKHMIDVNNTQHGIIKYMEAMAQVMAEAAVASQKAIGDSPYYAIDKWTDVVRKRAKELVREKQDTAKKLPDNSKIIEG